MSIISCFRRKSQQVTCLIGCERRSNTIVKVSAKTSLQKPRKLHVIVPTLATSFRSVPPNGWSVAVPRTPFNAMPLARMCRGCGRSYVRLGMHLARNRWCRAKTNAVSSDETDGDDPKHREDLFEQHYFAVVQEEIFRDIADFYWNELFTDAQMQKIRDAVTRWNELFVREMREEIRQKFGPTGTAVLKLLHKRMQPFRGLATEKQVESYAEAVLPLPATVENTYDGAHTSYNILLVDWVTMLLKHDKEVRRQAVARSEYWKTGACLEQPNIIDHMDKGSTFRASAFAKHDPDVPGQPRKLKIALQMAYDDFLGTKNALSPHAPKQLLGGFYVAIVNLDLPFRFNHENVCPLMITKESVLKMFDMIRVVAGADPDTGDILEEDTASPGAQARYLAKGVPVQVRNPPRSHPCSLPHSHPRSHPRSHPCSLPRSLTCSYVGMYYVPHLLHTDTNG